MRNTRDLKDRHRISGAGYLTRNVKPNVKHEWSQLGELKYSICIRCGSRAARPDRKQHCLGEARAVSRME